MRGEGGVGCPRGTWGHTGGGGGGEMGVPPIAMGGCGDILECCREAQGCPKALWGDIGLLWGAEDIPEQQGGRGGGGGVWGRPWMHVWSLRS